MPGISPSLNLLAIILFLLPGLAGVKVGLQIAKRGDWLNRIDTIAISFGVSLLSLFFVYLVDSFRFTNSNQLFVSIVGLRNELSTIPSIILSYMFVIVFSLFIGFFLGHVDFGRGYFTSNLLWRRFFDIAERNGDGENYAIRVRTSTGDELFGRVEQEGETALSRDIILENPKRVRYDEDGGVADKYQWTGYTYIHNQSISHIEFDRLEDADQAEAREAERGTQKALSDDYEMKESDAEIEQLEKLASESDNKEE